MNKNDSSDLLRINDLGRILNDNLIFIDVGARVGEFSTAVRKFSNAFIYGFETIPNASATLKNILIDEKFHQATQQ